MSENKMNNDDLEVNLKGVLEKYSELPAEDSGNPAPGEQDDGDGPDERQSAAPGIREQDDHPAGEQDDMAREEPDDPVCEDDFGVPTTPDFAVNLSAREREQARKALKAAQAQEDEPQREKGFKRFIKGLLPWKGDPVGEIVRKCVFLAAIVTVVVSCSILINTYIIEPGVVQGEIDKLPPVDNSGNLTWEDIRARYPDVDFPEGMQIKYAEVYAQNQDLVGWMTIDKLQMSFPILQTDDNDYYLKRSFNHKYTELGNPFLSYENSVKTLDRNTIIYGHSTRTSSKIFSKLFDYRTTRGFVNNPVIEFNTIYNDYKWKVYAVFITNATRSGDNGYFFNYIFANLSSDEAFEGYIAELDRRKLYTTGVDIRPDDKILTLSTCLYDFDDARLVIVARLVREGESEEVDVSLVQTNPNPQYPQAWHDKNGTVNTYRNVERWFPN